MKVLVTGAGGFIGSHLCEALCEKGYAVRALVHYNALMRNGWLDESPCRDGVEIVTGDARDFDAVHSALQGTDAVLHLAALIGIPYSYRSPLAYVRTNVEGTYNVLEAARRLGVGRVVHTSTSEVYGTARTVPISEDHPLQPQSPYAASKIGADQLALSYFNSFETPVTLARPFNTFGPRQSPRAVIPTIILQLLEGRKTVRLGNLSPTRDLNYVKDTVAGFIALLEADLPAVAGRVFNIGSGREISIGDLARRIADVMGANPDIEQEDRRKRKEGSEVERLVCDPARMHAATGWKTAFGFGEALAETVKWFEATATHLRAGDYHV